MRTIGVRSTPLPPGTTFNHETVLNRVLAALALSDTK
jgi:hypothetical protein